MFRGSQCPKSKEVGHLGATPVTWLSSSRAFPETGKLGTTLLNVLSDEAVPENGLSTPKQMAADFRTWHIWHHDKAVYREIYTRSVSALIVAVIGYFFVALGTSLKFEPISYLAWTILGIAVLVLVYTLAAKLVRAIINALKRRQGEAALKAQRTRNAESKRLEARRISFSILAAAASAAVGIFVNIISALRP